MRVKASSFVSVTTVLAILLNSYTSCDRTIKGGENSVASLCASEKTNALFQHGDGTNENPYIICTSGQFSNLASDPSLFGKSFELGNDLDLSELSGFNGIGFYNHNDISSAVPFTGKLNGAGHTIRNFVIRKDKILTESGGLFALLRSAEVSNLKIEKGLVYSNQFAGLLVGRSVNSKIYNVEVSGQVLPTSDTLALTGVGAVAGALDTQNGETILDNATGSAVLRNTDIVGGLVGRIVLSGSGDKVRLSDSTSSGNIQGLNGGSTFGGLVGYVRYEMPQGTVEFVNNRTSTQIDVVGENGSWVGGITGTIVANPEAPGSRFVLTRSSATGKITTPANYNQWVRGSVAGLFGSIGILAPNGYVEISRSFSTSQIRITNPTADPNRFLAGIIGILHLAEDENRASISNVFYNGSIQVKNVQYLGGLVAYIEVVKPASLITIENSYAKIEKLTETESSVYSLLGGQTGAGQVEFKNLYWNSISIASPSASPTPAMVKLDLNTVNSQAAYVGFDFENIWKMNGFFSPPELR